MILWLNQGERYPDHLGVEGDVLRADEYAALLDADATLTRASASANAMIAAAQNAADAILQAAQDAAEARIRQAEERYVASGRLGYAAGSRRALEEAHGAMQLQVYDTRQAAVLSQRRLAGVVMKAVEQIVFETNRNALFARIGLTLQRLIDSESYVTLRVHADDAVRARSALQQAAERAGWHGGFDVVVEADAALGSCVCEWDYGVLVTGLDKQLAAIRNVLLAQPDEAANTSDQDPEHGDADASTGFGQNARDDATYINDDVVEYDVGQGAGWASDDDGIRYSDEIAGRGPR